MQMGNHNVLDIFGRHAQERERTDWATRQVSAALLGLLGIKARVDHNRSAITFNQPHEIIHWHRLIMRVVGNEVFATRTFGHGGVTQCKNFVIRYCHDVSRDYF